MKYNEAFDLGFIRLYIKFLSSILLNLLSYWKLLICGLGAILTASSDTCQGSDFLCTPNFPITVFSSVASSSFLMLLSKSGDLEEELKNVTNNLKSLEAQAEKVKKDLRACQQDCGVNTFCV